VNVNVFRSLTASIGAIFLAPADVGHAAELGRYDD
jgi:hypothetical protein